LKIES